MKQFVIFGLLAMSGCAPTITTNPIQLTPANEIALQDGTPIARLSGYAGNPRATVSFVFANGDTLIGDAIMNRDIQNSMGIWGQAARNLSNISTVEMVAIDDRQTMDCSGVFSPQATNWTCDLSDGAIYRDYYVAPPPRRPP
jgi:hypothetical protein